MRWVVALALAGALLGAGVGKRHAASGPPPTATLPAPHLPVDTVFRHADHRAYGCTRCHSRMAQHGGLLVRTLADCRSCHHRPPVSARCTDCHADEGGSERLFAVVRRFTLPERAAPERRLPFRHAPHRAVACAACHTAPVSLDARATDCASCHDDHHGARSDCAACHAQPPVAAHPLAAHAGCGGAGCHSDPPLAVVPRSRPSCLVCHREQTAHRPGQDCVGCHALPPPTIAAPAGLAAPAGPR